MSLQAGQIVAEKYRIVRTLGQGGMGEVYEGENLRIHRRVAIKTLLAGVSSRTDVVQRFEREAQAAGRIGSEHIVEVLDMGDLPDGSRYMVMEFLEGTTLSDRIISRGRIPSREAARLVSELCEGLHAAHAAQIIHRDLKPANVFLLTTKQGRADFVKILDFGVSKFSVLADEMSMTRTGAVVGTPYYMSPEQAKGAKFIDARSDLYSVGVILYETITGQVPFNAQTFNELIFKIALESPPPPESFVPDLDPHFASLVRKAMAREPNERFQSALEFKQGLDDWAAAHDRARSSGPAGAGGAFLQGPAGFRGGGTQILNGPDVAAAGAQPFGPPQPAFGRHQAGGQQAGGQQAGGQPAQNANWQGPPQFDASQMQQYHVPQNEPLSPGAEDTSQVAPKKSGSATLAFIIALLVVMVGGGAVAAVMFTKHSREAAKTSSSTEPATSASTVSARARGAQATESAAVPGASTQPSATSVLALPNASGAPTDSASTDPKGTPPVPTSHPTGPVTSGGHTGPMPTAKPTSQPSTQPTTKPTSGRPITGDL